MYFFKLKELEKPRVFDYERVKEKNNNDAESVF